MKLEVGTVDEDIGNPLPETPFVARHYHSGSGPLCIVSRISGIQPPSYSVMFLEGTGGPAMGDVWTGLKYDRVAREFMPLRTSLTLTNHWP